MDGFKICGMHVDLHQDGADRPTPEMYGYLKRRMLSIMLCVNWVCEGAFDDQEWVSESTSTMQEEEVMGRDLDYEICVPCVVQWSMLSFWRFAHATNVHVDNGGCGFVQNTK